MKINNVADINRQTPNVLERLGIHYHYIDVWKSASKVNGGYIKHIL